MFVNFDGGISGSGGHDDCSSMAGSSHVIVVGDMVSDDCAFPNLTMFGGLTLIVHFFSSHSRHLTKDGEQYSDIESFFNLGFSTRNFGNPMGKGTKMLMSKVGYHVSVLEGL